MSAPQPPDVRRLFRVFVLDIGINEFAVQTWVSVGLVAMWAAFVVSGLLSLDLHDTADTTEAVSKTAARKKKPPLLLSLAQTIHQVLLAHACHAQNFAMHACIPCTGVLAAVVVLGAATLNTFDPSLNQIRVHATSKQAP